MAKVVPMMSQSSATVDLFVKHYSDMLQEVLQHGSVKPKYKHGVFKRTWNVFSIAICGTACCSPCLVWDCLCCSLSMCCCRDNPFKYGCGFAGLAEACTETFKDDRADDIKKMDVTEHPRVLQEMGNKYIAAFDACINKRDAKAANTIRGMCVDMLHMHSPIPRHQMLADDGNVMAIRSAFKELAN